jgi:WD40 repeat protein/serine/threonine protein kinase
MTLDPQRAKSLFLAALERPGEERDAYLEEACAGDAELRRRVGRLLQAHERPDSLPPAPPEAGPTQDPSPVEGRARAGMAEGPGTVIGPYKLLQEIGHGGMGTVYLAEQSQPVRRMVALKIIKPGLDSRHVIARFEAERQALALMDHPNIARVLEGGTTESGRPYFVMELVKGVPITRFCDERRLTPRQRLELFVPVCQAVQHAHQKGIIHRDLKPSNVLVCLYDARPVPKVIDFGIAKATGQKLTERTMFTEIGQVVGTLEYMSPEQAELNQLDIDTRSDIYSLGVLLYELLTGSTPLQPRRLKQAAILEALRLIREEEAPRPSTRLSTTAELPSIAANRGLEPKKLSGMVRGELDWIVMKCLEKDRNRRYETANGLAADLERYLHDEPVQACPPSSWYRFRKLALRNKAALATGAVFAAGLAVAAAALALSNVLVTRERDEKAQALVKATEQEGLANTSAAEAKKQQTISGEQALLARRRYYAAQMNLAEQAWETGNPVRVLELLETQRPRFDQEDLRGFEWYYLWRLCNGKRRFTQRSGEHVAFSPDGKTIASSSRQGFVKLLDAVTGQEQATLPTPGLVGWGRVAFSPDGKLLAQAVGPIDDATVTLWDLVTRQVHTTLAHSGSVRCFAFTPDGKTLVTGSEQRTVKTWDVATGRERASLKVFPAPVVDLAISPDGRTLAATSGWDHGLNMLWDLSTQPPRETLHLDAALAVAFSPDGKTLVTGDAYGRVRLWDVTTGRELAKRLTSLGKVYAVAFSPGGETLAIATENQGVRLWEPTTGRGWTCPHRASVFSVAFAPDGKTLASGCANGTVALWDLAAPDKEPPALAHTLGIGRLAFSATGELLAATGGGRAMVWDARTARERAILHGHAASDGALAVSPDGKTLATGAGDHTIQLWEVSTGRERAVLHGHTEDVWDLGFSPDGSTLASASYDKTLRLWDVATNRPRATLLADAKRGAWIMALAYSSDGKALATAEQFWLVKLRDPDTGQERLTLDGTSGGEWTSYGATSVSFSPDNQLLAVGGTDGKVKLWNAATGELRATLRGHTGKVRRLAFFPDGRSLATGSEDATVKLWDVATAQERITLQGVDQAVIAPDGKTLVLLTPDGKLRFCHAATDHDATAINPETDANDPESPVARNDAADQLWAASRPERAEQAYREALARLEKLTARFPDVPEYRVQRARSCLALGLLIGKVRPEEGDQARREGRSAYERLLADFPSKPEYRDGLDGSLFDLGFLLAKYGRQEDAGRVLRQAAKSLEKVPSRFYTWYRLGASHAELGQWDEAGAALDTVIQLAPEPMVLRYQAAVICLARQDTDGYRQACAEMLKRAGSEPEPDVAEWAAWTCVLAPEAVTDIDAVVRLAKWALDRDPTNAAHHFQTLGAALYRAGRYEDAARRLMDSQTDSGMGPTRYLPAYGQLFLAMSHHRLGHAADARRWLNKAVQARAETLNDTQANAWNRRLTLQLLCREAEELLKNPPPTRTDEGPK